MDEAGWQGTRTRVEAERLERYAVREFDRRRDQVFVQFEDTMRRRGRSDTEIEQMIFSLMQTAMECRHRFYASLPAIIGEALRV